MLLLMPLPVNRSCLTMRLRILVGRMLIANELSIMSSRLARFRLLTRAAAALLTIVVCRR